jgi:hypothetical protein
MFEHGKDEPSSKPMWALLGSSEPPQGDTMEQRLHALQGLHLCMVSGNVIAHDNVALSDVCSDLLKGSTRLCGPRHCRRSLDDSLGTLLQNDGFNRVPIPMHVALATPEHDEPKLIEYAQCLGDAFRRLHVDATIQITKWSRLLETGSINDSLTGSECLGRVFLVGTRGKKGDLLDSRVQQALRNLDRQRISYRMFSLENQEMKWSAFDQAGILVEAAGGKTYSLSLADDDATNPLVFVGLDLGHPVGSSTSLVAGTVVDASGSLIGYFMHPQPRDETLRLSTLSAILNRVYLLLRKKYRGRYRVVVFRDGRLFENESPASYGEFFGNDYCLVEVVKNPVPLMLIGTRCAPAGTMCLPQGGDCAFVLTSRGRKPAEVNLPLKIRILYDGLALGLAGVSRIVACLSHAPTLGLSPVRSPVPIYWANGLAAVSKTNHQFSGIHWVPHN